MENNKGAALKARAYAFLLLKYRQRSEKEISDRLKKRNFPEELIKETIVFLREKKFIDDFAFARSWIRERLARSIGPRRLKQELKLKGIAPEIIEDNLREAQQSYSESETARELAASRLARMKSLEPRTAKRRLYAYLLRRGFSSETVLDIINKLD